MVSRTRFTLTLAVALAATLPAVARAAGPQSPAIVLVADERALYDRLRFQVEDSFDSARGGFVAKNGYPSESAVDLAFLLGQRDGLETWTEHGAFTVDWMLGLEDTLSGGFYGRAERAPGSTRLERPTLLNARRLENLIDAWQATGDTRYWVAASRLLEFADRNLIDGRGGFVANPIGDQDLVPEVNGVAIRAWYRWWAAARDEKRRDFARRSLERLWTTCWDREVGFMRRDGFGEVLAWPQISDQVEMGRALVLSAHLTGEGKDLERARQVADVMIARYLDRGRGGFVEWLEVKQGKITKRPGRPARENARATLFLCELAHVTGETKYLEAARVVWRGFDKKFAKMKLDTADWALALDAAIGPSFPSRPKSSAQKPKGAKPGKNRAKSPTGEAKVGAESGD